MSSFFRSFEANSDSYSTKMIGKMGQNGFSAVGPLFSDKLLGKFFTLSLSVLLLAGCASGPKLPSLEGQLTPKAAAANPASKQSIIWGGVIIKATNLATTTRLEVLTYPLDKQHHPKTNEDAEGRFIVEKEGYLETADYAAHRHITVHGQIKSIEKGKVGEADYDFPLVNASEIYLWPKAPQQKDREPRLRFGFGVILSN